MTGAARPRPSGLRRMATERPLARRSVAAAAALLGAGSLGGCVRRRETRRQRVDRVVALGGQGRDWEARFVVGKDFQSFDLQVDEQPDRVVLTLDVTSRTGSAGETTDEGTQRRQAFTLAAPRGSRRFVDPDGHAIALG